MTVLDVVVCAGLAATLATVLTALLRKVALQLPGQLWKWLLRRVTVQVTFAQRETAYTMLRTWLAHHSYSRRARNVQMVYDRANNRFVAVPGFGTHWIWYDGPLWIQYNGGGQQDKSKPPPEESYTVTMLATSHAKLNRFMDDISKGTMSQEEQNKHLFIYMWGSGYWDGGTRRKRDMKTVYMPERQKQEVIKMIDNFLKSEEYYAVRGIPWRLGIELVGPPGTGKTTLATALASHFNKPLYCMSLSSIMSDDTLMRAFTYVSRDAIVLIEDADTFECTQRRDGVAEESPVASTNKRTPKEAIEAAIGKPCVSAYAKVKGRKAKAVKVLESAEAAVAGEGITLSGLLNAIDGVAATEGRILIMTTNAPHKLDPALTRSGRIDKPVAITELGTAEVEAMFRNFYPEARAEDLQRLRAYADSRVKTAAVWQGLFIKYHDSMTRLFAEGMQ